MQESNRVFRVTTCDANGTRKDRPNGGVYYTVDPVTANTLTCVVCPELVVTNRKRVWEEKNERDRIWNGV